MTTQMSKVIQHLRSAWLLPEGAHLTDGQLLERFVSRRETAALTALVRRHGPMVWGVCRRILSSHHDAEDALQATFLVLVRKAASVTPREMVGNWLYGVARQTALKARATAAKLRTRERQVANMPDPAVKEQDLSGDLQALLDQELSRLPDKYRVAIVLCDLEGETRKQAARRLGLPEGTLAGRLTRGRAMLAKRLARHGLAVTGGTLAAWLSQQAASACVPASALVSTIQAVTLVAASKSAAAGLVSARVAALTEGVLKAMLMSKLKALIAVILVLGFITTGATVLTLSTVAAQSDKPAVAEERVDSVEGTWEIVSAVYDGRPSPAMEKRKWTFTKTHLEYSDESRDAYVIDSKANPKQITLTLIRPGNKKADGAKTLGIYEIKGDTLKMCVGYSDMRPRAFEDTPGRNLFTFKRVKSPPAATEKDTDQPALSAIKKLGGRFEIDENRPGKPVVEVDLANTKVTDADLATLKRFTGLERLYLHNTPVTDAGLAHLKGLSKLQSITLASTRITDAGMDHLKVLSGLKGLSLKGTKLTNAGLAQLQELKQLERLDLDFTAVTDDGLAHLRDLAKLQYLSLNSLPVTDAGLARLKDLTGLRDLFLGGTQVTDAGLAQLKGFSKLRGISLDSLKITDDGLVQFQGLTEMESLLLNNTPVTDAGIMHLKSLTKLHGLYVSGTKVSKVGAADLQKELPKLQVFR